MSPVSTMTLSSSAAMNHDYPTRVMGFQTVLVSRAETRRHPPDFEIVKSKIRANPEYVGERPYIRVQNPQYMVTNLVHHPPTTGTGKWYQVSVGRAVGVFSDWCVISLVSNYHVTDFSVGVLLQRQHKASPGLYSNHTQRGGRRSSHTRPCC